MSISKQLLDQIKGTMYGRHDTRIVPDSVGNTCLEYYGRIIARFDGITLAMVPDRKNYTTMMRLNDMLEACGFEESIVTKYREWHIEKNGISSSFGDRITLRKSVVKRNAKSMYGRNIG